MVRSYEDEVQVRVGQAVVPEPQPTAFLWRGRLYVVREVLAHWYERRAWWAEGAARAVHGEGEAPCAQVAPGADREVWRVEAGAGRQAGTGVYDLCRHAAGSDRWSLLRVTD